MREIDVSIIENKVAELFMEANYILGKDIKECIKKNQEEETFETAKNILGSIKENIDIAALGEFPLCQDTGVAYIFLEIGQDVHFVGGELYEAINRGVKKGYKDGFLRKSIVCDPLNRINTNDNTPAFITTDIVSGDKVRIVAMPKGFGAENMSRIRMLSPSEGVEGLKEFVRETCQLAGGKPCPPIILGIGVGGTFDKVALMAKKALTIPIHEPNKDAFYNKLENDLLEEVNKLGIGPQGLGGKTTALAVKIISAPTHIAGLPVAVNINCHVARHKEVIL